MAQDGIQTERETDAFLMIGQSNMCGRGDFGVVAPIVDRDIFMLRNGRFQTMSEPVNPDRGIFYGQYRSGVCLAPSFALRYREFTGRRVGLIPCADGGTSVTSWQPGCALYDNAVFCTKLALRKSRLKGILWHQGEADVVNAGRSARYGELFVNMITHMFEDIGTEPVPVIVGELGMYLKERRGWNGVPAFNEGLHRLEAELPYVGVAGAEGLACRPDDLHFDSPSLRLFGERYFDCWLRIAAGMGMNVLLG
jgi:hypothetical protein